MTFRSEAQHSKHSSLMPTDIRAPGNFCYVPSKSNVSYAEINQLHREAPNAQIFYGDAATQYAELWLPARPFSPAPPPLVVLIHGGCWLNAYDIQHTQALSTALRHSGYAVWSLEYRRTGDEGGGWPGTFGDIKLGIQAALDYVPENDGSAKTPEYSFDKNRIALVGHSAGGHLALLAGAHFIDSSAIRAVIGLAAIVDIAEYANGANSCETATWKFMGGKPMQRPKAYQAANPINQSPHPNTVLLHGSADAIVAPEQSERLKGVTRVLIDGAGHFDMVHPATPSFQALLKQLGTSL